MCRRCVIKWGIIIAILGFIGWNSPSGKIQEDDVMPIDPNEKIEVFDVVQQKLISVDPVLFDKDEWEKRFGPKICYIMRDKGTEQPFSGQTKDHQDKGIFVCAACGNHLFYSDDKFDSGTGWPSFDQPVHDNNVIFQQDLSHGMFRTEVMCARCGGHLGHVFNDGPPSTGKRFCINSLALKFVEYR